VLPSGMQSDALLELEKEYRKERDRKGKEQKDR
jgi:hypothetical protein